MAKVLLLIPSRLWTGFVVRNIIVILQDSSTPHERGSYGISNDERKVTKEESKN